MLDSTRKGEASHVKSATLSCHDESRQDLQLSHLKTLKSSVHLINAIRWRNHSRFFRVFFHLDLVSELVFQYIWKLLTEWLAIMSTRYLMETSTVLATMSQGLGYSASI